MSVIKINPDVLFNKPETFFVLRVNEDYTDIHTEEMLLPKYPKTDELLAQLSFVKGKITAGRLREIGFAELVDEFEYEKYIHFNRTDFGNRLNRIDDDETIDVLGNTFDLRYPDPYSFYFRILRYRLMQGIETYKNMRIIDVALHSNYFDWQKNIVAKNVKSFNSFINELEKHLKNEGLEYCSKIDNSEWDRRIVRRIYSINGRPFINVTLFLTQSVFEISKDKIKWKLDFNNEIPTLWKNGKWKKVDEKSFEDAKKDIFKKGNVKKKKEIAIVINRTFSSDITYKDIKYDVNLECYFISEEKERNLIAKILPKHVDSEKILCKYTTFDTAIKVLQNGKLRLSSIVSMNDKTETNFLNSYIQSYPDSTLEGIYNTISADSNFIVSLTEKIDELDMWRLYGDDTRGVCLLFTHQKGDNNLIEIKYVTKTNSTLKKISSALKELNQKKIRFMFLQLYQNRHYIKHSEYKTEKEFRYLENNDKPDGWFVNNSNGILTPYIEKDIRDCQNKKDSFPFVLTGIIIGNNVPEKDVNLAQLFYFAKKEYKGDRVGFGISKVTSYR